MTTNTLYFIYGLCVMFYGMMAWVFGKRRHERLPGLVALLMAVLCIQSLKDMFFLYDSASPGAWEWNVVTATDMIAVPMYAFILIELCRPNRLTPKLMLLHESPFVALPILLAITKLDLFYIINVSWAAIYGVYYACWTIAAIPGYHRHLRKCYSYSENINLNWLRRILFSFFIILGLWVADCVDINASMESVYMTCSLVLWMFICYFIYRHESVVDELSNTSAESNDTATEQPDTEEISTLHRRINKLFIEDKIFLNPHLKLSEVATMAGTNRTYLSNFFNRDNGMTFFDYINNMRVDYACKLLIETDERIEEIATRSGFNSLSTFRRAFSHRLGCTPTEYRKSTPPRLVPINQYFTQFDAYNFTE